MKKIIYLIVSVFLLSSCVYDKVLVYRFKNNTPNDIYVLAVCDKLPIWIKKDNDTIPINTSYISAGTDGIIQSLWGTKRNPKLQCEKNELYVFILYTDTIQKWGWEYIIKNNIYDTEIILTDKLLKETGLIYNYY